MKMTKLPLLATLLVVATSPSSVYAYCGPSNSLEPGIVSPSNIEIPDDGGIVVAAVSTFDPKGALPAGDPAEQRTWTVHAGTKKLAPSLTTLAPGLVVYRAHATGRIDLVDDHDHSIAWVLATGKSRAVLAAPQAVIATLIVGGGVRLDVELTTKPPKNAIAMVVADLKGTPRSWGVVSRDSKRQAPYAQNKCQVVPNGSVLSTVGDTITVAWVDDAGRMSPASAPIHVVAGP